MVAKVLQDEDADMARGSPGIGIDARGGGVIDPTKNVLDLVRAESKYQDGMRDVLKEHIGGMRVASDKFQDFAREMESRLNRITSEADAKRLDQLANLRLTYETRIAEMLRTSVESTSSLVSTQLVQIQSTFNERVAKLEQFRWESGGKTSVSDPALSDALNRMSANISAMQAAAADSINKLAAATGTAISDLAAKIASINLAGGRSEGRAKGIEANWTMIGSALSTFAVVALVFVDLFHH